MVYDFGGIGLRFPEDSVYDSRVGESSARDRIFKLFADGRPRAAGEIATRLTISRQAAHKQLAALVQEGRLIAEGQGRAARYRSAGSLPFSRRYPRAIIAEDKVWRDLATGHSAIGRLPPDARSVFEYAFTEMLNNAIEHSGSKEVEVSFASIPRGLAFEIIDEGRGAFANLRKTLGLASDLEALQELSKGKLTTLPRGHTGEGIFFTSKVADRFELESGRIKWLVDNVRADVGCRPGTAFVAEPASGSRRAGSHGAGSPTYSPSTPRTSSSRRHASSSSSSRSGRGSSRVRRLAAS